MPLEIERKFLVNGEFIRENDGQSDIVQGYLFSEQGKTVRVRISGDKAYLTIKAKAAGTRFSRYEWEKEIDLSEAGELLMLCAGSLIEKTRYLVPSGTHVFEVDVFHGDNEGLVIAEIELDSEEEDFIKPAWLGDEVTGDRKYYNSMLSRHPYRKW